MNVRFACPVLAAKFAAKMAGRKSPKLPIYGKSSGTTGDSDLQPILVDRDAFERPFVPSKEVLWLAGGTTLQPPSNQRVRN